MSDGEQGLSEHDAGDADAALLGRIAEGDRVAFDRLVERYRDPTFRYLRSLVTDPTAAEDALQETFLAVYRGAGSFRGEGSARAWVFGIARRQAARRVRLRAGEPRDPVPLHALGEAAGWGSGRDPEQLAAARADVRRVQRALATLSTADQEVIVLRDLEGMTNPEVAELLGLGVAAVKSRVHRARLRLMAALSKEGVHAGTS